MIVDFVLRGLTIEFLVLDTCDVADSDTLELFYIKKYNDLKVGLCNIVGIKFDSWQHQNSNTPKVRKEKRAASITVRIPDTLRVELMSKYGKKLNGLIRDFLMTLER